MKAWDYAADNTVLRVNPIQFLNAPLARAWPINVRMLQLLSMSDENQRTGGWWLRRS